MSDVGVSGLGGVGEYFSGIIAWIANFVAKYVTFETIAVIGIVLGILFFFFKVWEEDVNRKNANKMQKREV